jgi:hypothetical protein
MKKFYILISTITIIFIIFLITLFTPKDYKLNYQINNYNIEEAYQKDQNGYSFIITYNNVDYPLFINTKYSRKRKIITKVSTQEENEEICLTIEALNESYYICSNNGTIKTLNTMSDTFLNKYFSQNSLENKILTYKNIDIYNLENNYLIWNYKGFYHISNEEEENLNIFQNDNYQNNLSYQTTKYLIFPDYDSSYYFQKLYIYNAEDNILNDINFDEEISYDSYFLGDLNDKVYLLDKKNKVEYEINLKKFEIKKISKDNQAKYYNKNDWEDISLTKLVNNELTFEFNQIFEYSLENSTLYLNLNGSKIQISNQKVNQIIYSNSSKVYYLVDNKLYSYEYHKNEQLLLKYDEWNFNSSNHIFIFN